MSSQDHLSDVRALMARRIRATALGAVADDVAPCLRAGKMLRASLVFAVGEATDLPASYLVPAAAGVEMLHLASLLHDDVIDGGVLRHDAPAFWVAKGASAAVLVGDLLVCHSLQLVDGTGDRELLSSIVRFAGQMCDAAVEQDLVRGDTDNAWATCVEIARRKTGPLFAFAAGAGAPAGTPLRSALEDSGMDIGTAYQLADDILDASETDHADKSLGRDAATGKISAAVAGLEEEVDPGHEINKLLSVASERLARWPEIRFAWDSYVTRHLEPVVNSFMSGPQLDCAATPYRGDKALV